MQNRERDIIYEAIRQLEKETGYRTALHFYDNKTNKEDAALTIWQEDYQIEFKVEVKVFINRARLGVIQNQLREIGDRALLITEYVNPTLMETMENNGINFIDTVGNAFIKAPPLFVKIKGNKLERRNTAKMIGKTFNAAALQVIFTLLCNPGIERRTIRTIEGNAGVAIGTVHKTIQELVEQGFMLGRNFQRYKLIKKKELLELWTTLYQEKLKPKFFIEKYKTDYEQINNMHLLNFKALWGGEAAAAKLTNYLQPFIYTVYIGERQGEFILRNRLKKHPQGNLELVKKFWNFENYEYPDITHPILIYADLLATGDPRNIETAQIIYEKDVVRYIQED